MSEPRRDPVACPSQTIGPFFHFSLTSSAELGRMAEPEAAGEHIRLAIRVIDGAEAPVSDAMIEIWQADASGAYPDSRHDHDARQPFLNFGRLPTGEDGWCVFETIKPGVPRSGIGEAAHVNVCLFARGLLRQIHTRIYFAGDAELDSDPVLELVPRERRQTLLAHTDGNAPRRWTFEIRLQGPEETVFFDV